MASFSYCSNRSSPSSVTRHLPKDRAASPRRSSAFNVGSWKYADALRDKAETLRAKCGDEWNAHRVGQALWVASRGKLK